MQTFSGHFSVPENKFNCLGPYVLFTIAQPEENLTFSDILPYIIFIEIQFK